MSQEKAKLQEELIIHPFAPVFDSDSRVLILGTMPSRQSRGNGFYYGHPQNRFWIILAGLLTELPPAGTAAKREFLLRHRIALWDVIASCKITGSGDASIRDVAANDLNRILSAAPIRQIFCNGAKAYALYNRYCLGQIGKEAVQLPSTSSANAAFTSERLAAAWQTILDALQLDRP
ncbi:MAG TPA: DNA-deoxyinosine glycosylase [Clostridiales bacterium]|nr:DNA-deoxyinosine glycosylase [Clostridiales bacterium]